MIEQRRTGASAVVELMASLVTVVATVAVFWVYVSAHLTFLGDPVIIDAEDVRNYWTWVAVLALGVVTSFAAAERRGAAKAFVWHALVALAGLAVSVVFSVTETGPPAEPREEPPARHTPYGGGGCHSGGDSSDCVGG